MSERVRTHQARAERTADLWLNSDNRDEPLATIIARETYPDELVEAARKLLRIAKGEARYLYRKYGEEFAGPEIAEAEAALALYEEARHDLPHH